MFFSMRNIFKLRKVGRSGIVPGVFAIGIMMSGAYAASMNTSPLGGPGPAIVGGGGNLTSYSGNYGAINNAQWNAVMNPGKGAKPVADFGNCNALILRCASPKCPGGGCTDMNIARTIVRGCVQSNASCTQYGDDLVEYISAQLVASATAKAQETSAAAAAAAAAASSAQQNDMSSQQLSAMQAQMQQMQAQMAEQQRQSEQQIAAALAERNAAAAAAAQPVQQSAPVSTTPSAASASAAIESAVASGVSADTIARNQASGRILEQLENVTAALANVKKAMQDAFDYAGCDSRGENCTGPNRVSAFKQKASAFFDPFETVQDEVYDALIQAQALGVDISDIYMMLSSSCNVWGQYLCEAGQALKYSSRTYEEGCVDSAWNATNPVKCPPSADMRGKIVPMGQGGCQLLRTLTSGETIYQSWLDVPTGDSQRTVAVACASDALDNSKFFQNRRKKIDDVGIDDLALVLSQDAIVPAGKAPENLKDVCATDVHTMQKILMSGKYGTTAAEPQSEATNPTQSGPNTLGGEHDVCKENCRGYERYTQQGFSSESACINACDDYYYSMYAHGSSAADGINKNNSYQASFDKAASQYDACMQDCAKNYREYSYWSAESCQEEYCEKEAKNLFGF